MSGRVNPDGTFDFVYQPNPLDNAIFSSPKEPKTVTMLDRMEMLIQSPCFWMLLVVVFIAFWKIK
jgi:hypothetical protein